jgi:hypothetical protein
MGAREFCVDQSIQRSNPKVNPEPGHRNAQTHEALSASLRVFASIALSGLRLHRAFGAPARAITDTWLSNCTRVKRMKPLLLLLVAACLCAPAKEHDRDHGKHGGPEHGRHAVYFRPEHRTVIVNYYGGVQNLPPGLAKKWMRTGSLPPGWERRMRPVPIVVVHEMGPICATCGVGVIDRCAVVYDRKTRIILDVLALVDDLR